MTALLDSAAEAERLSKDALVRLGFAESEIETDFFNFRDTDSNDLPDGTPEIFIQVRFLGEDNAFVDQQGILVDVAGTSVPISSQVDEFTPLANGEPNSAAVPFNLDAKSRSFNLLEVEYFESLTSGSYDATNGFNNLGGVNFVGPPNEGLTGQIFTGYNNPFDALTIPVRITQPVTDLEITINPANDEAADANVEGIILWRDNDPLPVDMILVDEAGRGRLTINATGDTTGIVAGDDTQAATEDGNDVVVDLSTLVTGGTATSFTVTTQGNLGVATITNTSTLTYVLNADANGTDTIVYTASDGTSSDTGTITVNIAAVNDPPVANNDSISASINTLRTIQPSELTDNDTDVDGDTLTITAVTDPANANASVLLNGDGTISYTPEAAFTGTDTFTYTISDGTDTDSATVTVSVGQTLEPPIAGDTAESTNEDTAVTVELGPLLTGGAFDPPLQVTTNGTIGVASITGTTLTYTPNADQNGTDTIVYTATNAAGSDAGTISLTVTAVNDPPVADNESFTTEQNTPLVIQVSDLLDGDSTGAANENDTLSVTAVTDGTNGTAVLNNGTVTYTPEATFNGSDSFTYTLSDGTDTATGTVSVQVNELLAPVAGDGAINTSENTAGTIDLSSLLTGGTPDTLTVTTDGSDGSASISGTTLTYTPNANFNGTDSVVYTATNAAGSDTGTISVTVSEVNNPPTAPSSPVTVTTAEDTAATFAAATILSDATAGAGESSQTISISSVTSPTTSGGTASVNSGGGIDYTPAADFFGSDTLSVTIVDNGNPAGSVTYDVTVNVTSVNDAPTANDVTASVIEGSTTDITVLSNDSAGPANENQTLSVVAASSPDGTVSVNTDGSLAFTPTAGFTGATTISYTIQDAEGAQDSATVSVNVQDFEPSTVSGAIFIDLINNFDDVLPPTSADPIRDGVKGEGEDGLAGIRVRLIPTGDTTGSTAMVYTDMDGAYRFEGVAPGTYNVAYDLPDTVVFVGPTITPISIGSSGGESASGGNVGSLGLSGGLTNLDILVSSYMRANPGMSNSTNGGLEGGSVGLDSSGNQTLFKAGEGFDGVDFAELTLNENRDSALLTIIEDGVVRTAQLSEEQFVVSRDGTAVQFFGGREDFDFAESLSDLVTSEFENYRNAIDQILGTQAN